MRIGQNPAKTMDSVHQPARITAAVVTYIPTLGGYYADSLEILKLCLGSLRRHADLDFDLMVFDNASCDEARDYLLGEQHQGNIQYLVLSDKNIGKAGAWNYIFAAAPGEIVAYADSDVYFYPGWLGPQVAALEAFPNSGMVTGLPMLTPVEYSSATVAWAERQADVRYEHGRFLAWEDFWRHAVTLGGDESRARQFYEENEDHCIVYQGQRYYIGAAHFQFIARKQVLQQALPIPSERPMGQVRLLDEKINELGFLRLTTEDWHVRHMGNTIPQDEDLRVWDIAARAAAPRPGSRLARIKAVRKLLQWIYNRVFEILYRS
ncbi:MAG: glycosyltransferase family 2 protein [Anaerolineae bacterium]|nr:glycosyltransferase family 2 protein [Anaerolineae bacterium]